jgi:hypothetical protein
MTYLLTLATASITFVGFSTLFILVDLPLNFHPVAVRVSADVTPFGAMSVPA